MTSQVRFIGREEELGLVDAAIRDEWSTTRVICIAGPGGIGKTRLLQEVYQRYARIDDVTHSPLSVGEVLDFSNPALQEADSFALQVLLVFDPEISEAYTRALLDRRRMEEGGVSNERIDEESLRIEHVFVDSFNRGTKQKRCVFLVDTLDALKEEDRIWQFLVRRVPDLRNCVFVIAGRNAAKLEKLLSKSKLVATSNYRLQPFSDNDSMDYLLEKRKLLHLSPNPEMDEKLIILAGGLPILIDLALEWQTRQLPLDWLVKTDSEALKSLEDKQLRPLQEQFEHELVRHIGDTREDMDWLTLYMSHVEHPFNVSMIAHFIGTTEVAAKSLLGRASRQCFVRHFPGERIGIHDEMRRMIDAYLWQDFDPFGKFRRQASERAVEVLERENQTLVSRISELRARAFVRHEGNVPLPELAPFLEMAALTDQRYVVRRQQVRHGLIASCDIGMKMFAIAFDEATEGYRNLLREALLDEVRPSCSQLSPEQRYEFDNREMRHFLDRGRYKEAISIADHLLSDGSLKDEHLIDTLIQRGNILIRLGELKLGWSDFDSAVQISHTSELRTWLVRALNARGWASRNLGDFDASLTDYGQAYQLSLELDDRKRTGWVLNNLAYIHALRGNRGPALDACDEALQIWDEIGYPKGKGATFSTLGEISRWLLDDPFTALAYYQKALDIFTVEDDKEWISRARCGRASVYRTMGETEKAKIDLDYVRENGPQDLAPRCHYELAKVKAIGNDLRGAFQEYMDCRETSSKIGESFYDLMSLADIIELVWEFGEFSMWRSFVEELNTLFETRKDEESQRLRGSCLRKVADLAFCAGDYEEALMLYREGLPVIARFEAHRRHAIPDVIAQINKRVRVCGRSDLLARLGRDMADLWGDDPELRKYSGSLRVFTQWQKEKS